MLRSLLVVVLLPACAGSVAWDHCEPAICGADCDFEDTTCVPAALSVTPDAVGTVTASLDAQGSSAGEYTFSVEAGTGMQASVSPSSGTVLDGVLFEVEVSYSVDADATTSFPVLQLSADSAAGDSAGTSIGFEIP